MEETCLKEKFADTTEEKEYLLRVRHSENPFSAEPTEEITNPKELGRLTTDLVECPRTVFHLIRRTNRTSQMDGTESAETEEA